MLIICENCKKEYNGGFKTGEYPCPHCGEFNMGNNPEDKNNED